MNERECPICGNELEEVVRSNSSGRLVLVSCCSECGAEFDDDDEVIDYDHEFDDDYELANRCRGYDLDED